MEAPRAVEEDFVLENLDTISHSSLPPEPEPRVHIVIDPQNPTPSSSRACCYVNPLFRGSEEIRTPEETAPRPQKKEPVVLFVNSSAEASDRIPETSNFTYNNMKPRNDDELSNTITWKKTLYRMKKRLNISLYLYVICDVLYSKVENCVCFDVVWFVLHFSMIVISLLYLNDCKADRHIPVYLLEAGFFGAVMNSIHFWISGSKRFYRQAPRFFYYAIARSMHVVLFLVFITGLILVYSIYPPETEDRNDALFCHYRLYYFAFVIVNITLFMVLTFLTIVLALVFYYYH